MSTTVTSPAWPFAGRDPQSRLGRGERDRELGADCALGRLARRSVDAARHIAGDHERRALALCGAVDGGDRVRRLAARLAREPGAEDRVDDHRGAVERLAGEQPRLLAGEALQVGPRVAGELLAGPEQQHVDLAVAAAQPAGRNQSVAAVVALAADDRDAAARGPARRSSSASAPPAFSISSSDGIPRSSIAQASIARCSAASGSGVSQGGSGVTAGTPSCPLDYRHRAGLNARVGERQPHRADAELTRPRRDAAVEHDFGHPAARRRDDLDLAPLPALQAERLGDRLLGAEAGCEMLARAARGRPRRRARRR